MEPFTQDERERLLQALTEGGEARCPRCEGPLERTAVPPRDDVAYVRDRVWLLCPACARTVVLDRRKME